LRRKMSTWRQRLPPVKIPAEAGILILMMSWAEVFTWVQLLQQAVIFPSAEPMNLMGAKAESAQTCLTFIWLIDWYIDTVVGRCGSSTDLETPVEFFIVWLS